MADRDSGARRALPGEGTGMSGVVELAEQLAVAVKALELAQTALHKLCLARGSTDGYGHVFEAINAALDTA